MDKSAILFDSHSFGKVVSMKPPQPLSRQAIAAFKAIYEEEFHEALSDDEAREMGLRLLSLLKALLMGRAFDSSRDIAEGAPQRPN